jgi:site-specific recombinase XerD
MTPGTSAIHTVHSYLRSIEGTKPSTIHRYRYDIVRFEKWLVANGHPAREVVEERLVDFVERRRGICGFVHSEAPGASADLVLRSTFAVG